MANRELRNFVSGEYSVRSLEGCSAGRTTSTTPWLAPAVCGLEDYTRDKHVMSSIG